MAPKEKFSDIYSKIKVNEIIEKYRERFYYEAAFRIIKHSIDIEVTKKDFYPSIMEYNNYEMPSYDRQNVKTNLEQFGTSCFDTLEHLNNYIESVTSIREKFEKNGWFVMKGKIVKKKGFADKVELTGSKIGHFNYYLFDPINNSPVNDFYFIERDVEHE